jgi:hypothetical protein
MMVLMTRGDLTADLLAQLLGNSPFYKGKYRFYSPRSSISQLSSSFALPSHNYCTATAAVLQSTI